MAAQFLCEELRRQSYQLPVVVRELFLLCFGDEVLQPVQMFGDKYAVLCFLVMLQQQGGKFEFQTEMVRHRIVFGR